MRTEEQRQEYNARKRRVYRERRDQGLCGKCGKRWAEAGRSKCRPCRIAEEKYQNRTGAKEALREYQRSNRQYRRENGLCPSCGKKLPEKEKGIYIQCAKCRGLAREWYLVRRIRQRIRAQKEAT